MSKKTYPMTEEGLKNVKEELTYLETEKQKEVNERIKKARGFCDFMEDSEYQASIDELASTQERIDKVKQMIQHADVIHKNMHESIGLGDTVTIQLIQEGRKETYTIVGVHEADPFQAKISHRSPIAQRLLGAKKHEEMDVETPEGKKRIKVIDIK